MSIGHINNIYAKYMGRELSTEDFFTFIKIMRRFRTLFVMKNDQINIGLLVCPDGMVRLSTGETFSSDIVFVHEAQWLYMSLEELYQKIVSY
jgi:hypothetical protein